MKYIIIVEVVIPILITYMSQRNSKEIHLKIHVNRRHNMDATINGFMFTIMNI